MSDFYDQLAPFYHLIYQDWDASIRRQAQQLSALIEEERPGCREVLDVSCGVGTQAIALAMHGYAVSASDISEKSIERARQEAVARGLHIDFSVGDMRTAACARREARFDVVVSLDNSMPHLLSDADLLLALQQMAACVSIGGACLISVRDYEREERGRNLVKPYGVRVEGDHRYLLFQVWDFEGECYDLSFFFIEENLSSREVKTHVMRARYYAVSTARLCELMREAGWTNVRRLDGVFYQPILVGTRAA